MLDQRLTKKDLVIAILLCLVIVISSKDYLLPSSWTDIPFREERNVKGALKSAGAHTPEVDIVISYYNEEIERMEQELDRVNASIYTLGQTRKIIYVKGQPSEEDRERLLSIADEVIPLKNIGREGETYLQHITRHYRNADQDMAPLTFFLQPHLAWEDVATARLPTVRSQTGFMSFGPYVNQTCGLDSTGNTFPRMADIYSMFRGDFCPPTTQLATWAGQFVVSRKRILQNPLKTYQNLLEKFHAPTDHWIWKEGWWNNELSNPTLGHALERTWPVIFDCADPIMLETCKNNGGSGCECTDY